MFMLARKSPFKLGETLSLPSFSDRVDEKWTANYDFELRWAGPWYRKDYDQRYPAYAPEDTKAALASG